MSTDDQARLSNSGTTDDSTALAEDDLYEALSNQRRRHVIRMLAGGAQDIDTLSKAIAAAENDCSPDDLDSQQRKRVYIGLYQVHLETLDEVDIIDWDVRSGEVAPGATHDVALAAMRAVRDPLTEPDGVLDRVRSYLGVGA